MRERGVDARGPRAGRLVGPDGTARGWRTVLVGSDDLWAAAEPLPFLIQHDATGAEHQRQLGGVDGLAAHPNGATRIVAVVVATSDLPAMRERYARVLGMESAGDAQAGDELGAMTLTLNLDEGREHIVLARSLAQGYVTEGLLAAGASVCLVNIAIASCAVAERWLAEHGQTFIAEENGDLMVRVPGARGAPLRDWWMRLREQP